MRNRIGLLTLLALCLSASLAAAQELDLRKLPTLAYVTCLADLRALKPILVHDGWELRVGLADGGSDAAGWKLIYCLRTRTSPASIKDNRARAIHMVGSSTMLGPLQFEVRPRALARKEILAVQSLQMAEMIYVGAPARREQAVEELYGGTVPLWPDGAELVLLGPSDPKTFRGKPIARADLPGYNRPYVWQPLLHDDDDKDQAGHVRRVERDEPPDRPYAINTRPRTVSPRQIATNPLYAWSPATREPYLLPAAGLPGQFPPAGGYEWKYLHPTAVPASQPAPPPAAPADAADFPIRLSLEKDQFVLTSRGVLELDEPVERLLARWWVNGKPVEICQANEELKQQQVRMIHRLMKQRELGRMRAIRIPAALPPFLGKLAGGDIVRLQVMFSPGGYEKLLSRCLLEKSYTSMHAYYPAFGPMLSNGIDFFATPALIAAGKKAEKVQAEE